MNEPREYSSEEMRDLFLDHLHGLVDYWASTEASCRRRLNGLAFSLLAVLDGVSGDLPGFEVTACPHESDEAYCREQGENWWPANVALPGGLHERWAYQAAAGTMSKDEFLRFLEQGAEQLDRR